MKEMTNTVIPTTIMPEETIKILIVDDNKKQLDALEVLLSDYDYHLVRAGSGEEALRRCLAQDFAVIIMDVQMPGLDGFETAKMIRERRRSKDTPVIFVTGTSPSEVAEAMGYATGGVDYLYMPIVPMILRSKVAVFVDLFRKTAEIKHQAALLRVEKDHAETIAAQLAEKTTEIERINAELVDVNNRLHELDRMKSMFIATMSHELRTPLNSIIGFTGILLEGMAGRITQKQRTHLSIVQESGRHLLALINDVIDISKIEAGRIEPDIRNIDLVAMLNELCEITLPTAENAGLILSLTTPKTLSIMSDERRVKQVIMNLVTNAIKFTEEGEVSIIAKKKRKDIIITVQDTGIGIEKDDMDRLFEPFVRLETPGKLTDGTGLGLYLSMRLARILCGDITVTSVPGEGSSFSLVLPVETDQKSG